MCIIAKELKRIWPIVERDHVFKRFKHEKELSHSALVTSTTRKIERRRNKLGNTHLDKLRRFLEKCSHNFLLKKTKISLKKE